MVGIVCTGVDIVRIKAWFEIRDDKGNLEVAVENDILDKGVRWIMSAIANNLVADGYPANAAKYIHWGSGTTPVDVVNDFRLESFTGSLGQVTATVKTSDILISMSLSYTTGADPIYINEMAIACTANNPVNSTNYANAVIDRAVLASTYVIPPNTTKTITYYMKIYTT
jgi:hypothetical protein